MAETTEQPEKTNPQRNTRSSSGRAAGNRFFELVCLCATGLAIVILAVLLLSIFTQGAGSLNLNFLSSPSSSDPDKAGVWTALVGTIVICLICALSAIPLGVGTAVLIEEFSPTHPALKRIHDVIETNIRNLAGVPSIVYGLLGIGAFVFMFNVFGPINNGDFAIGQSWYDQYTDATGRQLYLPIDGPNAPAMPLYDSPGTTAVTEIWRTEIDRTTGEEQQARILPHTPDGADTDAASTIVTKLALKSKQIGQNPSWQLELKTPQSSPTDFTMHVQAGDEVRFNPYFDPTLNRAFYSSFEVVAVSKNTLQVSAGPIAGLIDAKDGSGKPIEYTLVSRQALQPTKTKLETQLTAFGEAIRQGMRKYRMQKNGSAFTRFPEDNKQQIVEGIIDKAIAEYPFDEKTLQELRPRLVEQALQLDGSSGGKTRMERNRFIKVTTDIERRKQLGQQVVLGQNPTRVDTKSWYHFALPLGRGVLAGGLTLMLVILPIVIVASQEALRAVPSSYRQGALALGATKWQSVSKTALPAAVPGIATGVILAISRAIGEAAPILVIGAAGYVSRNPSHLMDGFSAMPVTIFQWTREPGTDFKGIAAAGIIVLLIVLLSFNAVAIYIRQRSAKHQ